VNVASIAGEFPMLRGGGYSVSKAGLRMLSRVLSLELAEHRVRSNVVAPGLVRTPFSEFIYQDPEVLRQREAMIPRGRISTPADVAHAILFLASERADYINGQEILIDGGLSQTWMGTIPSASRTTTPAPGTQPPTGDPHGR
jgi:NAD(P)-dependent dehydrogenase (short-subunit alcohol dehydrogenase family)